MSTCQVPSTTVPRGTGRRTEPAPLRSGAFRLVGRAANHGGKECWRTAAEPGWKIQHRGNKVQGWGDGWLRRGHRVTFKSGQGGSRERRVVGTGTPLSQGRRTWAPSHPPILPSVGLSDLCLRVYNTTLCAGFPSPRGKRSERLRDVPGITQSSGQAGRCLVSALPWTPPPRLP